MLARVHKYGKNQIMGVLSTVPSIIHYSHPGSLRVKDKRHERRRHHERSIDPRLEIYISTGDPTTATLPDGHDTDSAAVSGVLSSVFISTLRTKANYLRSYTLC